MSVHWDAAYAQGDEGRSWYQPHAVTSLRLLGTDVGTGVVDVGGGASTLVDDLLAAGWRDVTVVDVSGEALAIAQRRLGQQAAAVKWVQADLRRWRPDRTFDVWHDRAVLHFLTDPEEQRAYREALLRATHPGSRVVIGVFGPHGPTRCSGLPVCRYDRQMLAELLGDEFAVVEYFLEDHRTPSGAMQQFAWLVAQRER